MTVLKARQTLAEADPALAVVDAVTPTFDWRVWDRGFSGLLKVIIGQQVSVASANAIWARLENAIGTVDPGAVSALGEAGLRDLGLSRPKARYSMILAEDVLAGRLDFSQLDQLSDDDARASLLRITGIGPWTAEIYLMFAHQRTDLFPASDVALQVAIQHMDRLTQRPTRDEVYRRADVWRPLRGFAAHLLWRYYAALKRKEISLGRVDKANSQFA